MKKLLVSMFCWVVLITVSTNAFAANIVYEISGIFDVKLNGVKVDDRRQVTWKFNADTDQVYTFWGAFGIPSMLRIDSIIGTVEIEGLLSDTLLLDTYDIAASIGGSGGVTLSLSGGFDPIIWLDNDDLINYNLETDIGPLLCDIIGLVSIGPYGIVGDSTFQVGYDLSDLISFEAISAVPTPSTIILLSTGLLSLAGISRKKQ